MTINDQWFSVVHHTFICRKFILINHPSTQVNVAYGLSIERKVRLINVTGEEKWVEKTRRKGLVWGGSSK